VPARRLLLFAAVLLAVGALAAALAPTELRRPATTQRTTPPPRATPARPAAPRATVSRTLRAGARGAQVLHARVGDRVVLTVEAEGPDEVAIGELRFASVDAFSPARFDFIAERPGTFPIRLRQAGRDLGRLVVQAR
jgi:hypothetical protein